MNIYENFTPHETKTCDDKNPPWMDKQTKTLIAEINALSKRLKQRMVNSKLLDKFDALQAKLQSLTNSFQYKYYREISKKLSDPSTSPICYWALLKTLLNGRKLPV